MLTTSVQRNVEQRAEKGPERVVRRGRLVLLAAQVDLPHVGAVLSQFLCESRLPDPGLADELDQRAEAHAHRGDGGPEDGPFALAVEERKLLANVRGLGSVGRRQEIAQHEGLHGLGLALEQQRLELGGCERSTAARERPGRHPDLVLSGASHQPRRKRRRVAEHGVRPPEAGADLSGEDASLAHTDVNRKREARVDDRANRSEHSLLVVAEGLRRARHEDDATAVAIDVAFEEGHLVLVRGRLNGANESVERVRGRLGSLRLDDLVRAGEADEGDRGVSVLSLERPDLEQLCA